MTSSVSSTCIVVLGMHRSGTSLVAGILSALGVNMGTRFRPPDIHNQTGYYEDLDWRDLNKSILNLTGHTWYTPPSKADVEQSLEAFKSKIQSLIILKSVSPLWGFKDPRTCITIPAIYHYISQHSDISPRVIYVRRDMQPVVDSLIRRAEIRGYTETVAHWQALYTIYNYRVIDFLLTVKPRSLTVTYEQLTTDIQSRYSVQAIAGFIGVKDQCLIQSACELVKFR